jgi:hypothetical protein
MRFLLPRDAPFQKLPVFDASISAAIPANQTTGF